VLRLGRTRTYELVMTKRIQSVKVGGGASWFGAASSTSSRRCSLSRTPRSAYVGRSTTTRDWALENCARWTRSPTFATSVDRVWRLPANKMLRGLASRIRYTRDVARIHPYLGDIARDDEKSAGIGRRMPTLASALVVQARQLTGLTQVQLASEQARLAAPSAPSSMGNGTRVLRGSKRSSSLLGSTSSRTSPPR